MAIDTSQIKQNNSNHSLASGTPIGGAFGAFRISETKNKQKKLYVLFGILAVILVSAIYYLFFYLGINLRIPAIPPAQELSATELRISRMADLNFGAIDSVLYKAMKLYGEIPIKIEALGRSNPFLPF